MKQVFAILILAMTSFNLFSQEMEKKTSTPLYADAIISVKTPQGKLKELIEQIGLQNKGVPAIDANGLAMETNIPGINATRAKMGLFIFALNNYYDEATETQLTVKVEAQVVTIKGQKVKEKKNPSATKTNEEFSLQNFPKNSSLKVMLESNQLEEILEKIKSRYDMTLLSFYDEKSEDVIHLYGSQSNLKILEKVLNKIEKKWQSDKNQKFNDLLFASIQEEKIESIETKIKDIEATTEIYKLHKNNAFEKLNSTEENQKPILDEIEGLKKQISENNAKVKLLNAELEKLKKQKPEK